MIIFLFSDFKEKLTFSIFTEFKVVLAKIKMFAMNFIKCNFKVNDIIC